MCRALAICQICHDATVDAGDAAAHLEHVSSCMALHIGRPGCKVMSTLTRQPSTRRNGSVGKAIIFITWLPPSNTNAAAAEVTIHSLLSKNQLSL